MKPRTRKLTKAFSLVALAVGGAAALSACSPADVASQKLSNAADNFQINRQINFIDTVTGKNIVTVRGLCSLGNNDGAGERSVTCKIGTDAKGNAVYIKDIFGLSSTVAYAEVQLGAAGVDTAHYSIEWNPSVLVPAFKSAGGKPLTPVQSKTTHKKTARVDKSHVSLKTRKIVGAIVSN